MKKVVRENIKVPYSLHDMNIIAFEVDENKIIMRMQSGMVKVSEPCEQVDGYVEFHEVDWDFCNTYIMDFPDEEGVFTGQKLSLQEFVQGFLGCNFEIIDEVFGYNQTKFWGWLSVGEEMKECILEIYHLGDMVYVENVM